MRLIPLYLAAVILASSAARADDPVTPADAATLWKKRCSLCHGLDGRGPADPDKADKIADLTSKAWQKAHTDAQIFTVIADGVPKTHMRAYRSKLTEDELKALVAHIRTLGK
ncbi:MAG: cytochrome c [Deltaproteobacteria bacterium]|nr:cytochrome c [Deltaproteobacteria bacterium]